MSKKYSKEEVKNILGSLGYEMISEDFISVTKHIVIKDAEGYFYHTTLSNIISGRKPYIAHKSNPYSINNIKNYIKINNIELEILSNTYENNKVPLIFKCRCGESFTCSLTKFIDRGKIRCNKCSLELRVELSRNDINYVKRQFKDKNYTPMFDEYKNCFEPLLCSNKEGYIGLLSFNNLKHNNDFGIVSKNNPYSIQNINKYITNNNLNCVVISNTFVNANTKLKFRCSCGNVYKSTWKSFVTNNNDRCDLCSKKQSKYAFKVEEKLKEIGIEYEKEHNFEDCKNINVLRFDFIVYKKNDFILIEVDGQTHFKPAWNGYEGLIKQQRLDRIKNEYCLKNNIKLLRIPYTNINNGSYENIIKYELEKIG
ncbi:MAG TPA: hypothetical protein DIC42_05210 [Holosporales bacterium]|nr:hypothetical protein [Holosporales bacterium]